MNSLNFIKTELDSRRGKFDFINNEISITESNIKQLKKDKEVSQKALGIIQLVAKQTQQKIEYRISNLITSCIQNLGKNYRFVCEFVLRRDKTEADLYLTNELGDKLDPYAEVGGSIVQIIDFALRCSLRSSQKHKLRNVLCLDEPFSGVKKNLHKRLSKILKDISQKSKLQIIIITHDNELSDIGDKKFILNKNGKEVVVDECD